MADTSLRASGIYAIRNTVNGKVYVGSAKEFAHRFRRHRARLGNEDHHSLKLQRAWAKYGADAFRFEILEVVEPVSLLLREQHWIEALGAFGPSGYNMIPNAGSHLGATRSPMARANLSAGQRGRVHPPETRARIGAAQALREPMSAETRAKLSQKNNGQKRSAEAIANMTAGQRAFVEAGKKRAPISEETRRKLADASRGRIQTPEAIAKMVAAKTGKKRPPPSAEWRAKISAALKARFLESPRGAKTCTVD